MTLYVDLEPRAPQGIAGIIDKGLHKVNTWLVKGELRYLDEIMEDKYSTDKSQKIIVLAQEALVYFNTVPYYSNSKAIVKELETKINSAQTKIRNDKIDYFLKTGHHRTH